MAGKKRLYLIDLAAQQKKQAETQFRPVRRLDFFCANGSIFFPSVIK